MTTPSSESLAEYAVQRWTAMGTNFMTLAAKEKDGSSAGRVHLLWSAVPMMTLYVNPTANASPMVYHRADQSDSGTAYTRASLDLYFDEMARMDTAIRKWPEYQQSQTFVRLVANGTSYGAVDMSGGQIAYTLNPRQGQMQRTTSLADLEKYTGYLDTAVRSKSASHTYLFIDSMRRL